MKTTILLGALLASTPAQADTLRTSPTRDATSQLERLVDSLAYAAAIGSPSERALVWDVDATASSGLAAGEAVGELTGAATVRVTGDTCDVAEAGVAVRGSTGSDLSTLEARVHGGLCFARGLYAAPSPEDPLSGSLFPLRIQSALAVNVAPRFSSARNAPRVRSSSVALSVSLEGIRYSPRDPQTGGSFLYMDIGEEWQWLDLADGGHGYTIEGGFGFFRLFRTRGAEALADRAIDILDIDSHGMRGDPAKAVALIDVYPVRLRGLGLGSDHVLLDLELGVATTGGTITSSNCVNDTCVEEEIVTGADVAALATWGARTALSLGTQSRAAGIEVRRGLDGNILGQVTLESRGTLWTQLARGRTLLRAEAFTGTATHYLDATSRGSERFTGAAVDTRVTMSRSMWAGLQLDGIATYQRDAVLAGPIAGSGVRAFATLGYHRELKRRPLATRLPE